MSKTTTAPQTTPAEAEQPKKRKQLDPEIQAMARVDQTLAELTPEQRERVLAWAGRKYPDSRTVKFLNSWNNELIRVQCEAEKRPSAVDGKCVTDGNHV